MAVEYPSKSLTTLLLLLLLLFGAATVVESGLARCVRPELSKCYCGKTAYDRQELYVVNCTDTSLSTAKSLEVFGNLPTEVEVFIFTGNYLTELPSNIFGTNSTIDKLRYLDMSNNSIKIIKGKSYHHVSSVERLVLNNNQIELGELGNHHPRVFSNFNNLYELHLTNAFADTDTTNITTNLYEIFLNSNLSNLVKLHLEQNKINIITEQRVFCRLPSMLDLHLSNNELTGINFDIACLPHLRFLDLENNKIRSLPENQLSALDSVRHNNQSLAVDISNNLFSCGCAIENLYNWLRTTRVNVRNNETIQCIFEDKNPLDPFAAYHKDCQSPMHTTLVDGNRGGHKLVMVLVFCVVFAFLGAVLCVSRFGLKRLRSDFNTSSRKIHYTTIGRGEEQEIHV